MARRSENPPLRPDEGSQGSEPVSVGKVKFPRALMARAPGVVVEHLTEGLLIVDAEGLLIYWNPAALKLYGFASAEDAVSTLPELPEYFELSTLDGTLIPPQEWPLARILRGETLCDVEIRLRRLRPEGGASRVFRYSGSRVSYADNRTLGFLTVADITESKRTEAALRRSEASLAAAQSRAKIGSWEWVRETRAITWSAEMLRILGRGPLDEPPTAAEAISMVHRDDRHALRRALILAVAEHRPFVQDLRIVGDDAQIRWLDCRGHVRRDPGGNSLRMSATAQDITVRKQHERELERLNRLNVVLSHVNQAIVRNTDRTALFQHVCSALVEKGGFRLAWVGWFSHTSKRLVPVVHSGLDDVPAPIAVYADDSPEGHGPSGTAFKQGRPYICNDVRTDPAAAPWREVFERRGLRSSAAFPIRRGGKPRGILSVYSEEPGFFRDREIALLQEAADDLSFALDHFASETARRRAQALVDRERLFTEAVFRSLPGVLYLYNEQGRFLRWNPSFTAASGYSDEEVARMHPLDFFSGFDKPRVEHEIRVVFERGESSIEAAFVSKDGSTRPYFFTGKRIVFRGVPCLLGMGIDITIRKNAEAAMEQYARRLQATSHRLLTVQEAERRYLARELHDAVGQELTAISLNLTIIDDALPQDTAAKLRERLEDSQELLEETTRNLRNVMMELRPAGLDELGLLAALKEHASQVARRSGVQVTVSGVEPEPRLTPTEEIAFFRIAQEALNNVVKHSRASECTLVLRQEPQSVVLRIMDNGVGFDTGSKPVMGGYGMGTTTMRERAEALGARLQLESSPGEGTAITVELTWPPSASPEPKHPAG